MLLLHIAHGEISEGRLLVIVESRLFHLATKASIISAHLTNHIAKTEGITEVCIINILVGEVVYEIILCTCCHKGVA